MSENAKKVKEAQRKKKNRISAGYITFFVVTGIALYIFFTLYSVLNSSLIETYILDMGEISNTIVKDMLILREQYVIQSPAAGYISYYCEEGDRIRKGGMIGKIQNQELKGDENISLRIINRRINELKGGNISQNPEAEIAEIDYKIDFLFSDIQNRIHEKDYSYIPMLKSELMTLVERKKLIQGASSLGDITLDELEKKKTAIENKINSDKYYIRTEHSGILSFYHDGQEKKLSPKNVHNLSVKDIQSFRDTGRKMRKEQVKSDEIVAGVVGNHQWYFITEVQREDIEKIDRGKLMRCFIEGEEISAKLEDFFKGNDGKFVGIFRVENENYDFTEARKHQIQIEYKHSFGLMIKKESVTTYQGKRGIFVVNEVGLAEFKEIKEILGENEEYCTIAYHIDALKQPLVIGLYDEVIIDPTGIKQGDKIR